MIFNSQKKLAIITFCTILLQNASAQFVNNDDCKQFILNIAVENLNNDTIKFLYSHDCDREQKMDTLFLKNGKATLTGKINRAAEGILFTNLKTQVLDGPKVVRFIMEPANMHLSFSTSNDSAYNVHITGSKTQAQKTNWEEKNSHWFHEQERLENLRKLSNQKSDRHQIIKAQDSILAIIINHAVQYIRQNPDSYLSGYFLRRYIRKIPLDSVKNYYTSLSDKVKYSTFGKQVLEEIFSQTDDVMFRQQNSDPAFFNRLSNIKNLYDIALPDESGKTIDLSEFKGKYVVLDFWASWCGPCIKNIPYLKKLMAEMKNAPVAFVSISLDKDAAEWKNAIKKHHYPGLNLIDSTELAGTFYKIPWVPVYMIINPDGKIVNANAPQPISGQLEVLLKDMVNNKKL